jgi:hypothetical protein
LAPQIGFATGKLGRKASNFSVQLQCASVDVELVEFVPTSAVLWIHVRGACAVTVTVTVTVTVIRWVRHGLSSANSP